MEMIEGFGLSPQQRHLWLLQQAASPESYATHGTVLVTGALDKQKLQHALKQMAQEYEILRTSFQCLDGMTLPVQVIADAYSPTLYERDLTGLELEAAQHELGAYYQSHDFTTPTEPFTVTLATLAPAKHLLYIALPALYGDNRSLEYFVETLYQAYCETYHDESYDVLRNDLEDEQDDAPMQYADLAEWLNDLFVPEEGEEMEQPYWHEFDFNRLSSITLPAEEKSVLPQSFDPRAFALPLSPSLVAEAEKFAQCHGVAVADLLLTCWAILLWRHNGESNLLLGLSTDGRPYEELESALGLFAKTVPLSFQLHEDLSFQELVQQLGENLEEVYESQLYFDWEQIAGFSMQEAETEPFFPFAFEVDEPLPTFDDGATSFSLIDRASCTDRFKLKVTFAAHDPEAALVLSYDPAYYQEAEVARLADQIVTLLSSALQHPTQPIDALDILSEQERHYLLVEFNATALDYPLVQGGLENDSLQCFHQLFEAQVTRVPEQVAVLYNDEALTYAELNAQANQLAHTLQGLGVGPDKVVGLAIERSCQMVISLLAILKAGGAYLPLDPTYPQERLSFIAEDAQAEILVTQQHLLPQFQAYRGQVVSIDQDWEGIQTNSTQNPNPATTGGNLVYVIYTSGSTGKPKGTMITQRGLVNYLSWATETYDIATGQGSLVHSPLGFDLTVTSLLGPLSVGQRVELLSEEAGIEAILERLQSAAEPYSLLKLTPSHLTMLEQLLNAADQPTLHEAEAENTLEASQVNALIIGGEALWGESLTFWQSHAPSTRLINEYGPTETVVGCCVYEVIPGDNISGPVPIGRPIANTQLYVLDRHQQPVPIGVPGELYIGGDGVARGYLSRDVTTAELSAEKFIADPFHQQSGGRLYRTGDLVRHRPDGNLEFLGRMDQQVKLRGFRIELGEIEATLASHTDVHEAVVLLREDTPHDQRLVAYVVRRSAPTNGAASNGHASNELTDILLAHLQQTLPEYMWPSNIVILDRLPLTTNAKVDRKALPAPESVKSKAIYVAPTTETEIVLAEIWSEVLNRTQVGIHDDFFELGGHSLLATQVVSRLRMQLNLDVPLRTLFDAPQLATFAQAIAQYRPTEETNRRIEPVARNQTGVNHFPLSFAQQRLWFLDQLEPESPFYNIPAMIRLRGELDIPALEQSFNYLIRRHEGLRTTFEGRDSDPMQVIHPPDRFLLSSANFAVIIVADEEEALQQGLTEANTPFDLSKGPLLRVRLLKIDQTDHLLVLNMHHIISDGWSVDVLVEEFVHAYTAYAADAKPTLPELTIQYADFAQWQRAWLAGDVLEQQLDYWRNHLTGAPTRLELLTDRPRPPVQSYDGGSVTFQLEPELAEKIRLLSQESSGLLPGISDEQPGASLFMIFYTAFAVLLSRYSGQDDIVIGTPIANRNRAEIEPLMGFFVNTLALRTDLSGDPTFLTLLERVRQQTLDAYMHQDIPFEQLVEELQPERSLSHSPIFQVLFSWQHMSNQTLSLPGLEVTPLEPESVGAKFDLDLDMQEVDGQIQGILEYSTDLFDVETVQRIVSHFQTLLESIVANPSTPITDLPLMTPAEEHQILVEWNQTAVDYPLATTFPELFAQQAAKTPNAIAATYQPTTTNQPPTTNYQITYAELDEQSTRVAQWLLHYNPPPESAIALVEERGIAFLTAMLGILKAGYAYLPLDPNYPAERIAQVLGSSQAPLILTSQEIQSKITEIADPNGQILLLEELLQETPPIPHPLPKCHPDQLAYIIYTSGSTGVPKGAMLEHKGLLNHLYCMIDVLGLTDQDVVLQNASQSFDISVWQLLTSLLIGGRIHIVDDETAREPGLLLETVIQEEVTIFELVPTLLRLILDKVEAEEQGGKVAESPFPNYSLFTNHYSLSSLRWLIPTGEALPPELCRRWLAAFPHIPMLNAYGPSECSDDVTLQVIDQPPAAHIANMPIGGPVANMQVYILDKALRPVPIGVAGELYIGGVGVGRGYLNNSEQTEQAFLTDPFDPSGQGRFYKTGDLARYLSQSAYGPWNIEFLGRVDHQVKVRGFRIELGEIEAALANHPAVRENVVVVWEATELVAYVAPEVEWEEATLGTTLRKALRQQLPDYMLPTAFVFLERLPLTPNGKIDRRALPAPTHSVGLEDYVPPSTLVEERLASVWAEVLNHERVGIHDSFFDLGGHSLLAVQVVTRIRERFQIEFTVRDIFETPTIAEIAAHIELIQQTLAQRLEMETELAEDEEELEL